MEKKIILLNTHIFNNLGDYAIIMAELSFFRKILPEYDIIEISARECCNELAYLKKFIDSNTVLAVTGGGFLGTLWMEYGENNVRKIIESFPNNKIVIMPQTMYFEEGSWGDQEKINTARIYGKHQKLTLCMRNKDSYNVARTILPENINIKYIPDMVMFLNESYVNYSRRGILCCFRDDKERAVEKQERDYIYNRINKLGYKFNNISMCAEEGLSERQYMDILSSLIFKLQTSQLVITDRLHCMLLCAITGTPCIALDNVSKKNSGSYMWISNLKYIDFLDNIKKIDNKILTMIFMGQGDYDNKKLLNKYFELAKEFEI